MPASSPAISATATPSRPINSSERPIAPAGALLRSRVPGGPLINPEQVSPMVSVRKSRRTGAGRLVACRVSATQDCGQTPWARLVDSESLGDVRKARIPRRAACPGSPACTAPRGTNCRLSGRHATYSGSIRWSPGWQSARFGTWDAPFRPGSACSRPRVSSAPGRRPPKFPEVHCAPPRGATSPGRARIARKPVKPFAWGCIGLAWAPFSCSNVLTR